MRFSYEINLSKCVLLLKLNYTPKSIDREKRSPGWRDNNYFDCNGGIMLYVIWNINLLVQNIAKYLFEMERVDVRIEHVLEFSIKIVLSTLKIGYGPDCVDFPVEFSPGLVLTEVFVAES